MNTKNLLCGLSAERLRQALEYNPKTGDFHWKYSRGSAAAGRIAGTPTFYGYRAIKIDGTIYKAHRLAWLYVHGEWPIDHIDHVNGKRDDNRIENLREVSHAENMQNIRKAHEDSLSGLLGTYWREHAKSWQSRIKYGGKSRHLGYFKTAEEAHAAYLKAKAELHPFQTIADAK